jgi:hypothetical protein
VAHPRLRLGVRSASACALVSVLGCGPAAEPVRTPVAATPIPVVEAFPKEEARWPKFHSVRFRMSIPLPDGKAWKIDDHAQPELHAAHEPTRSRLVVYAWNETELMNRARCEDKARGRGFVPDGLTTVEDTTTIGPEAYDTRVWVAVKPGKDAQAPLVGHVFAFGAFIRRCLFVDFQSEVPQGRDEEALSNRLALVKVRLLGGLSLDAPRTTPDADIPQEKPSSK